MKPGMSPTMTKKLQTAPSAYDDTMCTGCGLCEEPVINLMTIELVKEGDMIMEQRIL